MKLPNLSLTKHCFYQFQFPAQPQRPKGSLTPNCFSISNEMHGVESRSGGHSLWQMYSDPETKYMCVFSVRRMFSNVKNAETNYIAECSLVYYSYFYGITCRKWISSVFNKHRNCSWGTHMESWTSGLKWLVCELFNWTTDDNDCEARNRRGWIVIALMLLPENQQDASSPGWLFFPSCCYQQSLGI